MENLIRKVANKVEQTDLTLVSSESTEVAFENGKLKDISAAEEDYQKLRVIKNGRLGTATTSKINSEQELISMAIAASEFGNKVLYDLPEQKELPNPNIFDERVNALSTKEMTDMGEEVVRAIKRYDSKVQTHVSIVKMQDHVKLINSKGFNGCEKSTQFSLSVTAELVEDDNILFCEQDFTSTHAVVDLNSITERLISDLTIGRINTSFKQGQYPVIFTPMGLASSLMVVVAACLNGKAVVQGMSPWKNRLGDKLFGHKITFINDGLLDKAVGSERFDSEGTPAQRFPLIEQGVLKNYLLDLQTAYELKSQSNGTASGNGPGIQNLVMSPGKQSIGDMIASIDKGVIIDTTMGAWAGNTFGGQVSGNISLGYKIDNGKIIGRIKDAMFSLNVFEALKNRVVALSKETESLASMGQSALLPYLMIDDVNIAVKS